MSKENQTLRINVLGDGIGQVEEINGELLVTGQSKSLPEGQPSLAIVGAYAHRPRVMMVPGGGLPPALPRVAPAFPWHVTIFPRRLSRTIATRVDAHLLVQLACYYPRNNNFCLPLPQKPPPPGINTDTLHLHDAVLCILSLLVYSSPTREPHLSTPLMAIPEQRPNHPPCSHIPLRHCHSENFLFSLFALGRHNPCQHFHPM